MKRLLLVAAAVANLLCIDLVTKKLALGCLKPYRKVPVIEGLFNITLMKNEGCAWGLLQGYVWPLAVFGIAALAFLVWKRREIFTARCGAIAEPLLYAGIIGNLIDRVFRGFVVDFFDFDWVGVYRFPCFNVADVCITIAAALLIYGSFFGKNKKKA